MTASELRISEGQQDPIEVSCSLSLSLSISIAFRPSQPQPNWGARHYVEECRSGWLLLRNRQRHHSKIPNIFGPFQLATNQIRGLFQLPPFFGSLLLSQLLCFLLMPWPMQTRDVFSRCCRAPQDTSENGANMNNLLESPGDLVDCDNNWFTQVVSCCNNPHIPMEGVLLVPLHNHDIKQDWLNT